MRLSTNGKRIGRPPVKPKDGARNPLGLRVTAAIRRRLDDECEANGRTLSQEAEHRIERSFWLDDLVKARLLKLEKAT